MPLYWGLFESKREREKTKKIETELEAKMGEWRQKFGTFEFPDDYYTAKHYTSDQVRRFWGQEEKKLSNPELAVYCKTDHTLLGILGGICEGAFAWMVAYTSLPQKINSPLLDLTVGLVTGTVSGILTGNLHYLYVKYYTQITGRRKYDVSTKDGPTFAQ